jgi:hypothetical protein
MIFLFFLDLRSYLINTNDPVTQDLRYAFACMTLMLPVTETHKKLSSMLTQAQLHLEEVKQHTDKQK